VGGARWAVSMYSLPWICNLFFSNNTRFVDDADKWLYNFASVDMESTEELPVESIEPEPLAVPPSQPQKNIARRKAGFTKQEDHVICFAFLNVSKDGATGRTHYYYCSHTTAVNYNDMCCRSKPIQWKLLQAFP
jgi:hypothetical protein